MTGEHRIGPSEGYRLACTCGFACEGETAAERHVAEANARDARDELDRAREYARAVFGADDWQAEVFAMVVRDAERRARELEAARERVEAMIAVKTAAAEDRLTRGLAWDPGAVVLDETSRWRRTVLVGGRRMGPARKAERLALAVAETWPEPERTAFREFIAEPLPTCPRSTLDAAVLTVAREVPR